MITRVINKCLCSQLDLSARSLHQSSVYYAKPGSFMKKIMSATGKRKHAYFEAPTMTTPTTLSKGVNEGKFSAASRRCSVLNKVFMRHVTDIMVTGQYSQEFLGYGIEINRVKIAPDFRCLNVFWVAKGTESDAVVDALLTKNAGYLRHELSALGVMGVVPKIQFIKDQHYSQLIEVDKLLCIADYGDDYQPAGLEARLKSKFELHVPLSQKDRDALKKVENEQEVGEEDAEEPIPEIPQNIFGLNHADIMTRVKKLVKKSRAAHRQENTEDSCQEFEMNEDPVIYNSSREQREAFRQFLEQRELQRSKAMKEEKYPLKIELDEEPILDHLEVEVEFQDYLIDEDYEKKMY